MYAYQQELSAALEAVRQACRLCATVQSEIQLDSLAKADKSPVTIADYGSQALVCRTLRQTFPDDPIIGEEDAAELRTPEQAMFLERIQRHLSAVGVSADNEQICAWIDAGGTSEYRPRFWTLDPIDGTKGFLRKEQYAVSLALIIDGVITLGVLGCPNLSTGPEETDAMGTLQWAIRGQGAWQAPLENPAAVKRIQVSSSPRPEGWRFCESVEAGHSKQDVSAQMAQQLGITAPSLRMDSQAKYAVVARGEADLYLRLPTRADYREKIWDHAGGVLIVTEAGGTVSDVDGKPLDFSKGRELSANRGVIVTNGPLHAATVASYQQFSKTP